MLGKIRKFSNSIFAKIFLVIVAIPFIFWGMGDLFSGGSKNTVFKINKEKISKQQFIKYVNSSIENQNLILDDQLIDKFLSQYIGEKLIIKELDNYQIRLSDESLSKIIKNQKIFKRDNKFSRTEYEKFLVENGISAVNFEAKILKEEKKKQLFTLIGSGVVPSDFLINLAYDKINQKRNVEIVNLDNVFKNELSFTNKDIELYYSLNKMNFVEITKFIKFLKLTPKNLTGLENVDNLFFKKIDEIDDLIVEGKKIDFIINEYNLPKPNLANFNLSNNNKDLEAINNFPNNLIKKVFNITPEEPAIFLEHKDEFYLVELLKTENVQKDIDDKQTKEKILLNLKKGKKRKLISSLISKTSNKNFNKVNFDNFASEHNTEIEKIKINSRNDTKILKQDYVNQIFSYPEKKVIVVTDIGLTKNFLVYIDNVTNVQINKNSEDYEKYLKLSKFRISNAVYNSYDNWLKEKYKVEVNYPVLKEIKNLIE